MSAQITVTVTIKEPTCFSWTNGEVTANPTGGTAPYQYSWSNGQGGGQTMLGVPAGNYTVTVTDAATRRATYSFTVGEPPLLVPNYAPVGNSCAVGASYVGSGTGGIPPYTYAWRNLGTNEITAGATLNAPSIGSYHLSVTDSRGCTMTKVANIQPFKLMVRTKDVTCGGVPNGDADAWIDGGVQPLTYIWNNGARDGIITNLPGGTYSVTVTDAIGCTITGSGVVNEPAILKPNLSLTGQCTGNATAAFAPTGGTAPYTYRWSTGATLASISGLNQGGYFGTVTDSRGCAKDTFFKVSTGNLGLNITKTDANCNGATGSATVTVNGGAIGPYSFRWSNGSTSETIGNLTAGTYTVTVTDGAFCTGTQSIQIQSGTGAGSLNLQMSSTNSSCGGATGTASVAVTGGTAPYTYLWNTGASTPSVSNLAGGNYTVSVTDANGCVNSASVIVQTLGNLTATLTQAPSFCGSANGSAAVNDVSGGRAPYTYLWSNGATTSAITNVGIGSYTVTVTDVNGCRFVGTIAVQAASSLILRASAVKSSCTAPTGSATVTSVTGGTAPYTYRWSNGATTQTISNVGAGTYTVTATDASGCTGSITVVVGSDVTFVIQVAATNSVCGGTTGTAAVTNVTGGTAPFTYTYRWSNGATTASVSGLAVGSYTVTVTDAAGCFRSQTVEVGGTANFSLNSSSTNSVCNGSTGSATVNVSGGTAPYRFSWSNGGTTATISNLGAGSYTVTVTDNTGCSSSTSVLVMGTGNFSINTSSTLSDCNATNGSATIIGVVGGTGSYTYRWSNGSTANAITNVGAGTYTVSVMDSNGCGATATVTVGSRSNMSASASATNTSCGGTTGTATVSNVTGGTGSYTYRWNNGATTASITNLAPGVYTVTISDNAGCTFSSSVRVFGIGAGNLTINTTSTASDCINPTGSASVTGVVNGTAPFTYFWSNGASTPSVSGIAAGFYFVTVTDNTGCSQVAMINVGSNSNLAATTSFTATACGAATGTAAVSNPTGGTAPYRYRWSTGATTPSVSNLAKGVYTVTVTDVNGCTVAKMVEIKALGNFTLNTSATNSDCLTPTGTASVVSVSNGGTPPFSYKWSSGGTSQTITNIPAGNYVVTVTDANGCEVVSSNIVVDQNSNIVAVPSIINATCGNRNGSITVIPNGGTTPYTYKWADLTGANQPSNRTNLPAGTYAVTVTDNNGCLRVINSISVKDTGSVRAQFAIAPQSCAGDSVTVRFINNTIVNSSGATYQWLFTGNRISTNTSPQILFNTITGSARLIAISADGCRDTLSLTFPINLIRTDLRDSVSTCTGTPVSIAVQNMNTAFPIRVRWSNGDTTLSTTITPATPGRTLLIVNITNGIGCVKTDTVIVSTFDKTPNTADYTWKQGCEPFSISFSYTGRWAGQYRWVFGDPRNPTAGSTLANPTHTYGGVGPFIARLIPSLACMDTINIPVTASNQFAVRVDAGRDTTVCTTDRVTLTATSNAANYQWSTNRLITPVLGTGQMLMVTPSVSGTTTYYVRSTNADGCSAIDSVVVNNAAVRVNRGNTTKDVCRNVDTSFTIINLNPNDRLTITWSPSGIVVGNVNNDPLRPIVRVNANGTLIGTYSNGTCTLRDTIQIRSNEVDAKATGNPTVIYVDEMVDLMATPNGSGYRYAWSPTVNNPNAPTTMTSPKQTTLYTVTVTDQNGCRDTAQVLITVLTPICDEPYVFIPRAFTPNGDGKNDKVFVRGDYLTEMEFVIYNRWGEQVFVTRDRKEGWDGTHRGQPVCADVYGYYVKGVCQKGESFFKKGNITVLK
jgi:gliding motility-associated-like protein